MDERIFSSKRLVLLLVIFSVTSNEPARGYRPGLYHGCVEACHGKCDDVSEDALLGRLHAHLPGDLEFITLLPIHSGTSSRSPFYCQHLDGLRALERIEAVRLAVKLVNENLLLGKWRLGADIFDTCLSSSLVLKRVRDPFLASPLFPCNAHEDCTVRGEDTEEELSDGRVDEDEEEEQAGNPHSSARRSEAPVDDIDSGKAMGSGQSSEGRGRDVDTTTVDQGGLGGNIESSTPSPAAETTTGPPMAAVSLKDSSAPLPPVTSSFTRTATRSRAAVCDARPKPEMRPGGVRKLVIGPSSSSIAEKVTSFLGTFYFMQLSYGADSTSLGNRNQYPFFFRTAPEVRFQAQATVAVLHDLGWQHVAIFASDDDYGTSILEAVLRTLRSSDGGPCAALTGTFSWDDKEAISTFIESTKTMKIARIVLLASEEHAVTFLQETVESHTKHYTWLGTSKWTTSSLVMTNQNLTELLGERVLSISPAPPSSSYVLKNWPSIRRRFVHHMEKLRPTPHTMSHNPWIKDIWEKAHNCVLTQNASLAWSTQGHANHYSTSHGCRLLGFLPKRRPAHSRVCSESVTDDLNGRVFLVDEARFILHTFYTAAAAFRKLLITTCAREEHHVACAIFKNTTSSTSPRSHHQAARQSLSCAVNYSVLQDTFEDMNLTGKNPEQAAYSIAHLDFTAATKRSHDHEFHREVAMWSPVDGVEWIARNDLPAMFTDNRTLSLCSSVECGLGSVRVYTTHVNTHRCCWLHCQRCTGNTVRETNGSEQCEACMTGYWPNADHSKCEELKPTFYTSWNLAWSIPTIFFAILLGTVALLVVLLFVRFGSSFPPCNPYTYCTPLLVICAASYLRPLVLGTPSDIMCTAQLLLLWPWSNLLYINLLLFKTSQLRSGTLTSPEEANRFIGVKTFTKYKVFSTLFAVATFLVFILWATISPPKKKIVYSTEGTAELQCSVADDFLYTYYSLALVFYGVVAFLSFRARKMPSKLNESKYVCVAAFFAGLLWALFLPAAVILKKLNHSVLVSLISLFQDIAVLVCLYARPLFYHTMSENSSKAATNSALDMAIIQAAVQSTADVSVHYQNSSDVTESIVEFSKAETKTTDRCEALSLVEEAQAADQESEQTETRQAEGKVSSEEALCDVSLEILKNPTSSVPPDDAAQLRVVLFNELQSCHGDSFL